MQFGRSSTLTLVERIEYRAICAVEVRAFVATLEFSHSLEPMRTVESLLSPRGEIRIIVFITGAATVCDNLARLGRPSATRIAPAVRHCRTPSMRC
jgi:hypothetical protein